MFYAFTFVKADGMEFKKKSEQLDFLSELGFDVVEHYVIKGNEVEDKVRMFANKITENDFASDGLVLTYNDIEYSRSLGITAKFPRDSIAFKWADDDNQFACSGLDGIG